MAKEKKSGGQNSMHEGLTTRSPPVYDSSRKPIGEGKPTVDEGATRSEVGEVSPSTIGPRSA